MGINKTYPFPDPKRATFPLSLSLSETALLWHPQEMTTRGQEAVNLLCYLHNKFGVLDICSCCLPQRTMSNKRAKTEDTQEDVNEDEWNWLCTDDPCTRPEYLAFAVADASAVYWEEDTNSTVFCLHGHAFSVPAESGQNNLANCLVQWYHSRFGEEKAMLIEVHRSDDGLVCIHLAVPNIEGKIDVGPIVVFDETK